MRRTAILVIAAILVSAWPAAAEDEMFGLLATVNGEPITIFDVLEECVWEESRLPFMFKGKALTDEVAKLRAKTIDRIIERKLVYADFKERGFILPREFVEDNLDSLMLLFHVTNRRDLQRVLDAQGSSIGELRDKAYERIAVEALVNDLCFRDAYASPKELRTYYEQHTDEFSSAASVRLQVLALKTKGTHSDNLSELTEHLAKKFADTDENAFKACVSMYSEGPNVEGGGDIGWIERTKMRKDFADPLEKTKTGAVAGPVKADEAVYFLRVAEVNAGTVKSFSEAKDEINKKLLHLKRDSRYQDYIDRLKALSLIKRYF